MKYFVLYSTLALGGLSVAAAPLDQAAPVPAPVLHDVPSAGDDASKDSLKKRQLDIGGLVEGLITPILPEEALEKRQSDHDQYTPSTVSDNSEGQLEKRQADPSLLAMFGTPEKTLEYFASFNQPRQLKLLDILIGDLSGVVPAVTRLLDSVLDLLLPPVLSPALPRAAEPTTIRQYSPEAVLSALSNIGYPLGTGLGLATTTLCIATTTVPIAGFLTVTITRLTTVTAGPVPIIIQGLTALEGAISSVLNEVIPSELLPGVTIAASANLPLGLSPAISLTVPGLSIPAITLPPPPTVAVTLPSTPSIQLPSVSLPSVSAPSVQVPSLSVLTLPPVPTLPSISLPSASLPSISVPSISVPSISVPSVSLPSVSLPSVSLPSVSLPSVTLPSLKLPAVSLPSVSLPSLTLPTISLPNLSLTLPIVSLPSLSLPSVSLPTLPETLLPGVTIPGTPLPGVIVSPAPGLTLFVGGISANLPVVGTVGIPALIDLTVDPSGFTASGIAIPAVTIPPLFIPPPVQAVLPNILSQLSQAVATETPLVPGLIAVINGLVPIQTPAITQPIGNNIPIPTGAPILPSLLSEIGAAVGSLPSAIPSLLSSLEPLLLPEPTFSILPFPPFPNPSVQLPTFSILPFPPIATLFPNPLTALPTITFPPLPTAIPTLTTTRSPPFINLGPPISVPNILTSLLPPPTSPATPQGGYRFNAMSNSNVAVYYGQSQASERISLADVCADPNVDLVILGFVTDISYQNSGLPRLTLAPVIKGVKTGYQRLFSPGLDYYAQLEEDIKTCQATHGKKVLVSLGGGGSSLVLRSESEAQQFANKLWELFGPVTPATTRGYEFVNGLRPFGTAVVDGFDLAKLDSSPNYWGTFAATMRFNFLQDTSKMYYLSAAPGCASPDRSIPIGYLAQANFIWPRFFGGDDTGRCEIGGENFLTSILSW
ncbi:hypothetical protein QC762_0031570 [Podospora pseudocomata]|uniref:GH18 domain-containing protein n=1 Tax=Podospora pseudocomata TaxID=2093779 RepID=A0ABR0GPV7_9PEZI|nr:hypothetical protein QC762_0031570 [Podospora pseudocomata]